MVKGNMEIHEKRNYKDSDWLIVLWETANIVKIGKVLIRDKEGHAEVDITWVLNETVKG